MVEFPPYLDKSNCELRVKYLEKLLEGKDILSEPWDILVQELWCRGDELRISMSEFEDCFITFEQSKAKLENIEQQLATRLNISGTVESIREKIINLIKTNQLAEDELVQDWHQAYASYIDYLEHKD